MLILLLFMVTEITKCLQNMGHCKKKISNLRTILHDWNSYVSSLYYSSENQVPKD